MRFKTAKAYKQKRNGLARAFIPAKSTRLGPQRINIPGAPIRRALYHFINGVYSGLPICCSAFFSWRSFKNPQDMAEAVSKERGGDNWQELFRDDRYLYVPCNRCFRKEKFVKLKKNGSICSWLLTDSLILCKQKKEL